MDLNYVYSESTVKPLSIEFTKNSVYLRQNVTEEVRDGVTFYIYEEACLTPEEFNVYSGRVKAANAIKGINDSSNISNLISGQENGDNNQLIIMEAMADLYDLIASML